MVRSCEIGLFDFTEGKRWFSFAKKKKKKSDSFLVCLTFSYVLEIRVPVYGKIWCIKIKFKARRVFLGVSGFASPV